MEWDAIIAGAGCAGLALAARLVERRPDIRLVVADADWTDRANHKLWSWWCPDDDVDAWWLEVPRHAWTRMRVATPRWARTEDLDGLAYVTVRGEDYRDALLARLRQATGVTMLTGRVTSMRDLGSHAEVHAGGQRLRAPWAFQSVRLADRDLARAPTRALKQHFGGWVVRTPRPTFDPGVATLMDFTVEQVSGALTFLYVLPFSEREALFEYTLFSPAPLAPEDYERALHRLVGDRVGGPWEIVRRETGVLPMEDRLLSAQSSPRVFNIGAVGGMLKPSTGYAFRRIQDQASHIARTLVDEGRPTPLPRPPGRFHAYDTLLLDLLLTEPEQALPVFDALFARTRFADVLRFLDEGTSVLADAAMFARLPWAPFLRAAARVATGKAPPPRSAVADAEAA